MIDENTLNKVRKELPAVPFRTGDLAFELDMDRRKLAFILSILRRLGEVSREEVRVQLGGGFKTTRSYWRKIA